MYEHMTRKELSQFETYLLLTQWLEHSNAPFAMCTDAAASDHLGAAVSGGSVTSFDLGYVPLEFRASAMLRVPLPEFTGDEHVKQARARACCGGPCCCSGPRVALRNGSAHLGRSIPGPRARPRRCCCTADMS